MDAATETRRVLPSYGLVTVIESPVDEDQRQSGLIVPAKYDGDDGLKRGVVLDVGPSLPPFPDASELLQQGCVVYYRRGVTILGVTVVDLGDVVAYEADQ